MHWSLSFLQRRRLLRYGITGLAGSALTIPASAQPAGAWPARPIRLVNPFAPGGTSDIVSRAVAGELSKQLGVQVFVDNKGGGGGVPAMQDVAKAAPDGYTMIIAHVGNLAVNPYIFTKTGYDVNKDFAPITLLTKVPSLFVVHPDVPAKTFKEFVAYVKANPGKLNYASAGNASAGHLAIENLKLATGMFMTHIPYRGTGPALTDLLAGITQVFSAGTPALLPYIKSGRLRALATGTPQRLPSLPDIPTVAESGYPGFESVQWYGLMAPAGTPPEIIKRLQEESYKALRSPNNAERFAREDATLEGGTAAQFGAFITQQQSIWKGIVIKARIKPD
jgi:tripartite-type tricarboxylate transporter receptor subunit TctC